jgi:hypothetical protein
MKALVRIALMFSIPFIADNTRVSLAIFAAMTVVYLWDRDA